MQSVAIFHRLIRPVVLIMACIKLAMGDAPVWHMRLAADDGRAR